MSHERLKMSKLHSFLHKNGATTLFIRAQIIFLLSNPRENYIAKCLRCISLVQKHEPRNTLPLIVNITFLVPMFQIFTTNLLIKFRTLEIQYLCNKLSYTDTL